MAHARAQIVEALASDLAGIEPWGVRVYAQRPFMPRDELVALYIYVNRELVNDDGSLLDLELRELEVICEGRIQYSPTFDADADAFALALEAALVERLTGQTAAAFPALVQEVRYLGTEKNVPDEQDLWSNVELTFSVSYYVDLLDLEAPQPGG